MHIDLISALRALHILVAALWLGAAALLTLIIFPAIRSAGASGGTLLAEAVRRGLPKFMASVAGLTVLSGLVLYWQWSGAVGAAGMHSTGGILLMLGAAAGLGAAIIGGAFLGPTVKRLADLASAGGGDSTLIDTLHQRGVTAARFALALLVTALLLMAMSRFG